MFKFPLALAVGVTATLSAAHADTFIIQGIPSHDPAIVIDGDVAELPVLPGIDPDTLPERIGTAIPDSVVPGDILDNPAFHRLAELCDTMGLACDGAHDLADGGQLPAWLLPHDEDAAKRIAELIEQREEFAEAMEQHFETLPTPHAVPFPRPPMLFGWNAPSGVPRIAPLVRPHVTPQLPQQFGYVVPLRPHLSLPQGAVPRPGAHDLSGFYHRLNTPAVVPRSILPGGGAFPWHRF